MVQMYVHTYLWICHCDWDNDTGQIYRYNHVGFDGEDYMKLQVKEKKYIPQTQEAATDAESWNNKTDLFRNYLQFITDDCISFLRKYLELGRTTFNRTVPPKVYLLQRNSSSPVVCLATGFYPAIFNITWRKNGQEHHEHVETGETLTNMDKTFQKRISLRVRKEEWKKNRYTCVVQHKSLKKDIQKILTEDEIISNHSNGYTTTPIGGDK
ncbi:BOLA class I histocompatibility antigen, alpha chain BL3-6-like [Garra rufa]|uniref:BOLA class I histocompatibility antigen, alpha chain BL3-6-like n=1 Tax=Garra rufa TaxID=137080 RepID=UPI003CCEF425